MRLSRASLLRLAALPAALAPPWVARAVIGEITGPGFVQADDKSWDVTLPPAWKPNEDLRAEEPAHLFHLRATRSSGDASVDVLVDRAKGKGTLKELGKLDAVGARYAPSADWQLAKAAVVPGAIKGSTYYSFTYEGKGGASTRVKLGVQQNRVYQLALALPASPSAELEAEAASIVESFKVFPVNIICLSQSNKGAVPVGGSCY